MRIETGHVCKDCCYYILEENDNMGYCCIEPLFTDVEAMQPACESYVSDRDDDDIYTRDFTFYNDDTDLF